MVNNCVYNHVKESWRALLFSFVILINGFSSIGESETFPITMLSILAQLEYS